MSVMGASTAAADSREPRVRELARDAVTLMAFSAGVSVTIALLLLLGYGLGH